MRGKCKDEDGDRQLASALFNILVVESRTATHPLPWILLPYVFLEHERRSWP